MAHDKTVRESFTKTMASYYEQVRVCGVCCNVYTCLDWARNILGHGDAYGAGLEGKGAAHPARQSSSKKRRSIEEKLDTDAISVNSGTTESSSITEPTDLHSQTLDSLQSLKDNLVNSRDAVNAETAKHRARPSVTSPLSKSGPASSISRSTGSSSRRHRRGDSPIKGQGDAVSLSGSAATLLSASVGPSKATWKDRVTTRSKIEAEQLKQSKSLNSLQPEKADDMKPVEGAKFLALDDYLRSGAEGTAVKKLRQQQQLQQQQLRATDDDDDGGRSMVSADVYRGRVLFASEDSPHARAAVAILEEAYFAVL